MRFVGGAYRAKETAARRLLFLFGSPILARRASALLYAAYCLFCTAPMMYRTGRTRPVMREITLKLPPPIALRMIPATASTATTMPQARQVI